MTFALRRAAPSDGVLLASHCAAMMKSTGLSRREADPERWGAFFAAAVADGTYVAVIAESDGTAVGSGAYAVRPRLARPWQPPAREGRLIDVYVAPQARRRGIARAITDTLIGWAKSGGLVRLTLWPADDARSIYAAAGFRDASEMVLMLEDRA